MSLNEKINIFALLLSVLLIGLGGYFLYAAKDINANKKVEKYFSFVKVGNLRSLDEYIVWLLKWSRFEAIAIFAISACLIIKSFVFIGLVMDIVTLILLLALITIHVYTRVRTPKFYVVASSE